MEDAEGKRPVVAMETANAEKSKPLEVDLGVSSENVLVIDVKPPPVDDDDVPLLISEKHVAAKKKTSAFLKLITTMIFLISVIMVISSLVLTYERRVSRAEPEIYRVEAARLPRPPLESRRVRIFRGLDSGNLFDQILSSVDRDLPNDLDKFFDRSFNFYLDSLHHLRDSYFPEFRSLHTHPGDFIKIRLGPAIGEAFGQKAAPTTTTPSSANGGRPAFCSRFKGLYCKVLFDTGNARLAVLSSIPENESPVKDRVIKTSSSWLLPLNHTTPTKGVVPTVIPVVHSAKVAAAVEKQINIKPEVIPHYCPHLGEAPNKDGSNGIYVLFPGKTRDFTDYFMTSANNASENLDVAASIFYMNTVQDKVESYKKLATNIKAVIFPMRDVPEEVLHQFYCLGIPMFVPLVDFAGLRTSGESGLLCNTTDTLTEEIVHHTFYSGFPHVVHYSCFYELVEKLNEVDLGVVRENMWKDNVEKNKEAQGKLEKLRRVSN